MCNKLGKFFGTKNLCHVWHGIHGAYVYHYRIKQISIHVGESLFFGHGFGLGVFTIFWCIFLRVEYTLEMLEDGHGGLKKEGNSDDVRVWKN